MKKEYMKILFKKRIKKEEDTNKLGGNFYLPNLFTDCCRVKCNREKWEWEVANEIMVTPTANSTSAKNTMNAGVHVCDIYLLYSFCADMNRRPMTDTDVAFCSHFKDSRLIFISRQQIN